MSPDYLHSLIKECRETSEEAIFKLKLMKLLLYFLDQFSSQPLLSCQHHDPHRDLFPAVTEEEIIEVLLNPSRLQQLTEHLPHILAHGNVLSADRTLLFTRTIAQLND